ncbi:MAG TPA: hypothetical protein VFI24_19565 [Pyrinomonadaceae bacterium]|nr:hypothetical protein [Pyrinomonadaceae bacterium]
MLWWIGTALIVAWFILWMIAPRGWAPMLLISGISLIIIETAAYRRSKRAKRR